MRWRVAKKVLRAQARGEWLGRYGTYLRALRRWMRKVRLRRWHAGRDVAEAARAALAEVERLRERTDPTWLREYKGQWIPDTNAEKGEVCAFWSKRQEGK